VSTATKMTYRGGSGFSLTRADLMELTRVRLTAMILITVAAGFVLASPGAIDYAGLAWVLIGLGLVSGGATALNQVLERVSDGLMARTEDRPLPQGRLKSAPATLFGSALILAGLVILYFGTNPLTALVAAISAAVYVFLYTPLKKRSSFNTLVGAISGALPPVVGWTAAAGSLTVGAVSLFSILFIWQLVHLFAIAWVYRDQYERAGLVMLSVIDSTGGRLTMRLVVLFCLALLPTSLLPVFLHQAGLSYAIVAIILGIGFLIAGIVLARDRTRQNARRLFIASIIYLPLILLALLVG